MFFIASLLTAFRVEFIHLFVPIIVMFIGCAFSLYNLVFLFGCLVISFSIVMIFDHTIGVPPISLDYINKKQLINMFMSIDSNSTVILFSLIPILWCFAWSVPIKMHLLLMSFVLSVLLIFIIPISSISERYFTRIVIIRLLLTKTSMFFISHQKQFVSQIISFVFVLFVSSLSDFSIYKLK